MDEKIYDDIYFTLVTMPQGHPADTAAEIVASLASKHWLPVAEEFGVHFMGMDDDSGDPQEVYLVAEDAEDAVAVAQTINAKAGAHARIAKRDVGMWHPLVDPPSAEVEITA